MEGIESGTAKLIGTDYNNIIKECNTLLNTKSEYQKMAKANNPYGDGTTSKQIVNILKEVLITEYHPHKL
jgi:UDP-N-acetylglucosamine 2-epimerase (non-hydrolysing)